MFTCAAFCTPGRAVTETETVRVSSPIAAVTRRQGLLAQEECRFFPASKEGPHRFATKEGPLHPGAGEEAASGDDEDSLPPLPLYEATEEDPAPPRSEDAEGQQVCPNFPPLGAKYYEPPNGDAPVAPRMEDAEGLQGGRVPPAFPESPPATLLEAHPPATLLEAYPPATLLEARPPATLLEAAQPWAHRLEEHGVEERGEEVQGSQEEAAQPGAHRLEERGAEEQGEEAQGAQELDENTERQQQLEKERLNADMQNQITLLTFLIENGYEGVNTPRRTMLKTKYPLHTAAKNGDAQMVRLLLAEGADLTRKDSSGMTPRQVAQAKNSKGSHAGVLRALGGA